MRIGVIADTHSPEFLDDLPAAVFDSLAGSDLILHAGDVGGLETLEKLRAIAPVEAVRGDHDGALDGLPRELVVEAGGLRIALVHGNRSRLVEEPVTFLGTVSLGTCWPSPGLHRALRRRFPDADVVVYGHTHTPAIDGRRRPLVFNPGAVYQVDRAAAEARLRRGPSWFEWSWLQVIRHRVRVPEPSVGVLEVEGGRVSAQVLRLR